ncbi:MAG: hypothetical protein ACRYFZ_14715 [Janthinobacterium lividum]
MTRALLRRGLLFSLRYQVNLFSFTLPYFYASHSIRALDPQAGPDLSVVGDTYRIVTSGAQTDGAYAIIDMLVPLGGGPGPHALIQESFYVIEAVAAGVFLPKPELSSEDLKNLQATAQRYGQEVFPPDYLTK